MNYVGTLLGLGIGLMFVGILVGILYYVAFSWSHMKALKALGYDKAWLAWIPFGVLFACSDAVTGDADQVRMFNSFEVPDCAAGTVGFVTVRTACYSDQPGAEHYILRMHLCEDVCTPGAES